MPDETLLKDAIVREAVGNGLLVPFDASRVKGASYDFAVGRTIIIVNPGDGGITPIDLEVKRSWSIPPGRAAIIYSLEKVRMPLNMKGRLSMRSRLATQLLLFPGGPIDPGYKGYLFLPLANLGDVPITIRFGEPIVTGEFIRLGREAEAYSPDQYDSIPQERLPAAPPQAVYDLGTLTTSVIQMQSELVRLRRTIEAQEPDIAATRRIVDVVVLGALGGIGAGSAAGGIIALFTQLPAPWNIASGLLALGAIVAVAVGGSWGPLRRRVTSLASGLARQD